MTAGPGFIAIFSPNSNQESEYDVENEEPFIKQMNHSPFSTQASSTNRDVDCDNEEY